MSNSSGKSDVPTERRNEGEATYRLALFGGFALHDQAGEVVPLPGKQAALLLAILALNSGRPVSRPKLIGYLWADRAEPQARSSLRQTIWRIRQLLGPDSDEIILSSGDALRLADNTVEVDVERFEELLAAGTPADLDRAAELYRGDVLDGIAARCPLLEEHLGSERERLRTAAVRALSALVDIRRDKGDIEAAVSAARRLTSIDPFLEEAHRALMGMFAEQGAKGQALKQYDTCKEVLRSELGVDPDPETQALYERIKADRQDRSGGTSEPGHLYKPSIAVLPFTNLSGDPEQEYLADGITEDLITALSKIRWFFVIARNSTFTYKGQAVEVRQIARELGVRYVLEGSIQRAGDRVRISAQLIDATTGQHVWAERYDREIEDIFQLQDEMTQTIVAAVEPELGAFERDRALRTPPQSLDAWETYQRGLWHMWSFTRDDNDKALPLLRRARELDPNFAAAYAYEGYSHFLNVILGYTKTPGESLAAALAAAKKAVALDDQDPAAYLTLGRVYMMRGEHDTSIAELERSLRLNPNFAPAYFGLGFALALAGRFDEALGALDKAIRLNPRDPLMWAIKTVRSLTYNFLHQYEAAAEWARQAIREPRATSFWPHAALASALGNLDQIEEACHAVGEALRQNPDLTLSYLEKTLPTKRQGELQPYLDGLRKAGLPA